MFSVTDHLPRNSKLQIIITAGLFVSSPAVKAFILSAVSYECHFYLYADIKALCQATYLLHALICNHRRGLASKLSLFEYNRFFALLLREK
jgi:hypothetical protein